jgi:LmbE family N-acetylglucosaminyl deacetylase/SAM-dependent methyltransferase
MTGHPGDDDLPRYASVLAVCAHPDDESFGLGAVLDHFVERGTRVSVLCFTLGEASTLGAGATLGEQRRGELHAAARELRVDRVTLFDHPDGSLGSVPLDALAGQVATMVRAVGAEMLLVFDEQGVTGHPDHVRATAAALAAAPGLPVLAWTVPERVARELNAELGTDFAGRPAHDIDVELRVDRTRQRRAIARHVSQCASRALARRLALLGDTESLRWLRRPAGPGREATAGGDENVRTAPVGGAPLAEEWDRRYASTERLFRADPDETLVEVVTPLRPGRAADLGAGEGRNSLWLAAHGWDVSAVDVSREALSRLERAARADGLAVTAVVDDLTRFVSGARADRTPFDLVVVAYVHGGPVERVTLVEAAASAVGPGGFLFVVGHHAFARGVAGPFDPTRLYTEDDLQRAARGLEVLRLERRHGKSDVAEPGTDLVLWARRPPALRPTS